MRSLSLGFYALSGLASPAHCRKFDLHELPGSVQILHLAPVEFPIRQCADWPAVPMYLNSPLWTRACSSCIAKEKNDALDNLSGSVGFVGVGNGDFLHRRRADSHSVGGCVGSVGIPGDSGAQDSRLTQFAQAASEWAADC
jgi:hypothetical protein